jgi:hypothetical protein
MKGWRALAGAAVVLGTCAAFSCSPADFESQTVVDTIRVFASRASEPRARPGDTVKVEMLAYDGRPTKPEPMTLSWLPIACVNPAGDAYYACFQPDAGNGADAGASGMLADAGAGAVSDAGNGAAGLGSLAGADLSSILVPGSSFSYTIPQNIIIPRNGVSPSYGLVILFNFACGGHIELVAANLNTGNPQLIPFGCFDKNHNQLGADDFVFGFTRIYAYDQDPVEVNPSITTVDLSGGSLAVDTDSGTSAPFAVPLCTSSNCPHHPIGPVVPPSLPSGTQVWADFFSTLGTFTSEARLLYDPMATLNIPSGTNDNYIAPSNLSGAQPQNFIWIVVHDDQGGANWVTVPLQVTGGGDGGVDGGPRDSGGRD